MILSGCTCLFYLFTEGFYVLVAEFMTNIILAVALVCVHGVCMWGAVCFSLSVLYCQQHSSEQAGCSVIDTLQKAVNQLSEAVR